MSFRVTPEFKAKFDRIAHLSGRSVAQEIEVRLEQSLEGERRLAETLELLFNRRTAALMLAIGYAIDGAASSATIGAEEPRPGWWSNAFVFKQVIASVNGLLQLIGPDGDSSKLPVMVAELFGDSQIKKVLETLASSSGALVAQVIARDILPEEDGTLTVIDTLGPWGPVIRDWLGENLIARLRNRLPEPN
jgi:hypothetical protein